MIATRHPDIGVPAAGADEPRTLVVPVDSSPASIVAVNLATRLALQSGGQIILVDVSDGTETEPVLPTDEETQPANHLRRVLLPLQNAVSAAGVEVSCRLLHGDDKGSQLRALISGAGDGRAVVLNNPLNLSGALRDVTGELLLQPPCTAYLAGVENSASASWTAILAGVARWLWHQLIR